MGTAALFHWGGGLPGKEKGLPSLVLAIIVLDPQGGAYSPENSQDVKPISYLYNYIVQDRTLIHSSFTHPFKKYF